MRHARDVPGVRRIALLGSLATDKAQPKDVDLLVVVEDDMPLAALAKLKRRLKRKTMETGESRGADVFLSNTEGSYLGRVCQWKTCEPDARLACEAKHCDQRTFLCDDLQVFTLKRELIAHTPIDLWPEISACRASR